MKLSHLLGAVFLAASETTLVRAADCVNVALGAIPSCAQSCFLNGAPSVGCGGTDFACQCEQEARLYAAIEGCVSSGCPSASYQAVIDGASTGEIYYRRTKRFGDSTWACANRCSSLRSL